MGDILCLTLCIDGLVSSTNVVMKCMKNRITACWENGLLRIQKCSNENLPCEFISM